MKEKKIKNSKKNHKRKNGIWLGSTATADIYAQEKAEKLEKIIENIIFYAITIPVQLIQTIGVFVIAYFNNSFPELSFFLVGFFFTRSILGEAFHLSTTIACTTCTWTLFFLITAFIPSIYISVFLCILLGCLVAAYMNYIVVKDDENAKKISNNTI